MAGTRPFSPGVIDYDGRMPANYLSGRALSREAASTWCAILAPFVQGAGRARIVDLGAGTGRFAAVFARSFEVQVIGVEPSRGMLTAGGVGPKPTNLAYVAGRAERIPLRDKSCDVAWLSHVWHHLQDRHGCARELGRILRPAGHVLVRGTFGDQLDGFPSLFHYWPGTRDVCQQLPTVSQTVAILEANGFVLTEHRRVQQTTSASLAEFAKRTRLRADTALALISDSEFWEGQAAIEKAATNEQMPSPVIEGIELLVFRENSCLQSPAADRS
jgi:ubiquinone/menaquinone biosynthesis C-methylase UbiE